MSKTAAKRPPASDFAAALRLVRQARGLTQEDFDAVSSRVYISALERGLKQPTLQKVDELAAVLGVHPLALLAISYSKVKSAHAVRRVLDLAAEEVGTVLD